MSFELHERVKNTSCEIHNYTEIEPAVISPYTEATIRFVELKKQKNHMNGANIRRKNE